MKQLTNLARTIGSLQKLFRALNDHFFDGQLEEPVITVQSTPRAYAHVSVAKIWSQLDGTDRYELNIAAEWLSRDPIEICASMCHEMVHLAFMSDHRDDIKIMDGITGMDTSNNGVYHNSKFKTAAERCGLKISKMDNIHGWTVTEASDGLLDFCIAYDVDQILISRSTGIQIPVGGGRAADGNDVKPPKRPSSTRKLICPICGQTVRATKQVHILCGDCTETAGLPIRMIEI